MTSTMTSRRTINITSIFSPFGSLPTLESARIPRCWLLCVMASEVLGQAQLKSVGMKKAAVVKKPAVMKKPAASKVPGKAQP
eukprot:10466698-Lingulodinium_polyedra.AAC.1